MRWRHERIGLAVLLLSAAAIYLWNLGNTGWANAYYSAAAQAGAADWSAFLYGSSDAGNSITVDKPPAALWLMAASVRVFGLSPASVLLPEALLGVATVAVTYAIVRRHFGIGAALLAGAIVATMPAAALIFRYNNPDALLVFLVSIGLYATVRAFEDDRARWMLLMGAMFGLAFLTKQLQAFLILPAIIGVYLWAGPGGFGRRISRALIAASSLLVSAGWWVAIVLLVPSGSRPWMGGTTDDNFLSLTLGYNGLGRIFGGHGNGSSTRHLGFDRLFTGPSGVLVGWLIPAAITLAVVALITLRGAPRRSAPRATLLLLAVSMAVTIVSLSFMSGIYHAYYCVAAGPSIAGSAAIGASILWSTRRALGSRIVLGGTIAATALWGCWLLGVARVPIGAPFQWTILTAGVAGCALIVAGNRARAASPLILTLALVAALAGPLAISIETAGVGHSGSAASAVRPNSDDDSQSLGIDPAVSRALALNAADYRWVGATTEGSNTAARYQLANGHPVMAIGGYKRADPSPTLEQFQRYVSQREVHWYIGPGSGAIGRWVRANFSPRTIAGVMMYDLTGPPSLSAALEHPLQAGSRS